MLFFQCNLFSCISLLVGLSKRYTGEEAECWEHPWPIQICAAAECLPGEGQVWPQSSVKSPTSLLSTLELQTILPLQQ